jgi:hypothetical protein
MASFASDDVSGPISLPGTANFCFKVALPGGGEGRAVVGTADEMANAFDEPTRLERVAAALNFHVEGRGLDAVVDALRSPDGLPISLTGF